MTSCVVAGVLLLLGCLAEGSRLRSAKLGNAPSGEWHVCAQEGGEVIVPQGKWVSNMRFGIEDKWVEKPFSALLSAGVGTVQVPLVCGATAFGSDPYPGIVKQCLCQVSGSAPAAQTSSAVSVDGWNRCAAEGKECTCPKGGDARFGFGKRWLVTQPGEVSGNFVCGMQSFHDRDPSFNTRKECWCRAPQVAEPPRAKVAVVSVSKDPVDLALWMRYHFNYVGIEHLYLQMEETTWLPKYVESLPADLRKRVTYWVGAPATADKQARPQHDYVTLQGRQMEAMQKAKLMAQDAKYDWLLHIDDDELIYVPEHQSLGDVFRNVPQQFSQVVVPNVEAVYKGDDVQHCFNQTLEANTNVHSYASYFNGKPAVRLSDPNTYPLGPHRWQNYQGSQPLTFELDQQQPFGPRAMVVHYESCPFNRWEHKFWRLSNTTPDKIKEIPFPFYRDSIQRMQKCQSFFSKEGFAPDSKEPAECQRDGMRYLWAKYKTRANPGIRPWDVLPISIPWEKIQAQHA